MQMADVGGVPQEYGIGPEAVAAGTAGLLEIRLRALGHPHVDDKTDVGLVNAHAECIGTDHDADISLLPGGLPFGSGAGVQAGMVVFAAVFYRLMAFKAVIMRLTRKRVKPHIPVQN